MSKKTLFVTGIGTEVGKTVCSAIITQSLEADYWKPIQSGDLDNSDRMKVQKKVRNFKTEFHAETYALNNPLSPHASAKLNGLEISLDKLKRPETENNLVIEGAGGLLVPLNDKDYIVDLIQPDDLLICVSRHYLGSINHTLLSLNYLKLNFPNNPLGLLFNGDKNKDTEEIILSKNLASYIGRIPNLSSTSADDIERQADILRPKLLDFLNQ